MFCRPIACLLLSHHTHLITNKEGTQQKVCKRVQGVVSIERTGGQAFVSFVGGSPGAAKGSPLALRARTPPDYLSTVLMTFQIYAGLSRVGGPDRSGMPLPIHSLNPFLAEACYG
jgi:hypothetical protein